MIQALSRSLASTGRGDLAKDDSTWGWFSSDTGEGNTGQQALVTRGPTVTAMADQRLRLIEIVVLVSDEEVDAISERIGDAICRPADHAGPCETSWTLMHCLVDDLDEPRRSALVELSSQD